jgi:hypothetical protein
MRKREVGEKEEAETHSFPSNWRLKKEGIFR